MTRAIGAGLAYFTLVFAAGFMLGIVRTLWLEPTLGTRWAELAEMPVMLMAMMASACWIVRRLALPPQYPVRLTMGVVALALLLLCEWAVMQWLRGLTMDEYLAGRDPVSGSVYLGMLTLFVLLPLRAGCTAPDR